MYYDPSGHSPLAVLWALIDFGLDAYDVGSALYKFIKDPNAATLGGLGKALFWVAVPIVGAATFKAMKYADEAIEAKRLSKINVDPRKFSHYIFKEGADHGKDRVFRSLGYSIDNTDELVNICNKQAARNFKNSKYSLGRLDNFGQRIDIEIALPGNGEATGRTSYLKSGWMMSDDGSIRLLTPFAGFTR